MDFGAVSLPQPGAEGASGEPRAERRCQTRARPGGVLTDPAAERGRGTSARASSRGGAGGARLRLSGTRRSERPKVVGLRWAIAGERARHSVPPDSPPVRAEPAADGQQCPDPAAGGRRWFQQSRTQSAPFPRGTASPQRLPARGCPAGLPPLALGPLGGSVVLPRHPAASHPRDAQGRSLLPVGLRKVVAADGQWRGNDEGRIFAAFPCCRLSRTVCVSSQTGKYVQAWKTKAVNDTSNSWTKTSSFQRRHVWYLLDPGSSNYHFQLVS